MSCQSCKCIIGETYDVFNFSETSCSNSDCDFSEHKSTWRGIYVGMIDYFHVFNFDRPHYCPKCGSKGLRFVFPCNNTNYFDFSEAGAIIEGENKNENS